MFAFEGSFGFIAWFIGVSLTGEYYFNKHEAKTGRSKPESEWIKLNIEPIIDQDIFKRVAELKESRSPAKMPPRVVNSPTLLTGLLKCGVCGASMTLATGKGGRYRLLQVRQPDQPGGKVMLQRQRPHGALG